MTSRPARLVGGLLLTSLMVGVAALLVRTMNPSDDRIESPDAIVVLGGAGQERADLGIELLQQYDVPIVLSSSAQVFAHRRGLRCPPAYCVETDPESTIGEARFVSDLAERAGWEEVVVVTTDFHTTRARILFRQCLGDRVRVVGAPSPEDRPVGLSKWIHEVGGITVGSTIDRAC